MQTLNQFLALFERYLQDHRFEQQPSGLYEPVNYIMGIGGKRLRPAVLLMAYSMFDQDVEKALPVAFATEVFHNFTLLHDDIMDEAPLRRGNATVHRKYGINTGILSGDVMLVLAYKYLLKIENKAVIPDIVSIFTNTGVEVCEGQQLDMDFEKSQKVSIAEYLRMIELKTAVLVAGALKMGAILAGASPQDAGNLYEFGRSLGIAFQLQDDLLDVYGDPEKFGKKVGGDIAKNKKTFLYLKALELADPAQEKSLNELFNANHLAEAEKIRTTIGIYNQLNVRRFAEELMEEYRQNAFVALSKVDCPPEQKEPLERFAFKLMKREM